jgi:hypothetical protein
MMTVIRVSATKLLKTPFWGTRRCSWLPLSLQPYTATTVNLPSASINSALQCFRQFNRDLQGLLNPLKQKQF